jgi:hypothetical protein
MEEFKKRKTSHRKNKINLTLRKTIGCLHVFSMKMDWKYMELAARITLWHLRVEPSTARVTSQNASTCGTEEGTHEPCGT